MVYNRAPAKKLRSKFLREEEKQRSEDCFWVYPKALEQSLFRRHSKVCFDDIARYAFGLPNADFCKSPR